MGARGLGPTISDAGGFVLTDGRAPKERHDLYHRKVPRVEEPTEYVLVEAFRDQESGAAHVQSEHFKAAQRTLPAYLVETPRIVSVAVPQDDWSTLGEMTVPTSG